LPEQTKASRPTIGEENLRGFVVSDFKLRVNGYVDLKLKF